MVSAIFAISRAWAWCGIMSVAKVTSALLCGPVAAPAWPVADPLAMPLLDIALDVDPCVADELELQAEIVAAAAAAAMMLVIR